MTTETIEATSTSKPKPLKRLKASLTAAATRITGATRNNAGGGQKKQVQGWQDDAWDMYDLVGELSFLINTKAGRLSQAKLYVGKVPDDPTEKPEPQESGRAFDVFSTFGGGSMSAVAQIMARTEVNLGVAGDGYIAGIPKDLIDPPEEDPAAEQGVRNPRDGIDPFGTEPDEDVMGTDLNDLEWKALSTTEVKWEKNSDEVTLQLDSDKKIKVHPKRIFLIRVWNPHPRKWWEANSATRSSLPVLRELVGLTMRISAQIDSRLAGAGVFIVPQSAARAFIAAAGEDAGADGEDPFTEALIEAMLTPINDRSSASALVPLVAVVPDEAAPLFEHISFADALDKNSMALREEAIRRLALGQDAPPELLLGVGGMNHWGAWLVREDVITTHIEPSLALLCDALTTQFLQPVLIEDGMSEEEARTWVVGYDVSHMIVRPNRLEDAKVLHAAGVITDEALRDAGDFDDSDAPEVDGTKDPAIEAALALVRVAPTLMASPGLPKIVEDIRAVLAGPAETEQAAAAADPNQPALPTTGQPPAATPGPADGPPPPPAVAASSYEADATGEWVLTEDLTEDRPNYGEELEATRP